MEEADDEEEDTSEVMPPKILYIYSSLGLWKICYRTEILRGVRRSSFTALLGVITLISGSLIALISLFSTKPTLAVSAMILKMASAMFLLLTIIIFLAGIQSETSMAPPADDDQDQPSFHHMYGWSFHVLVVSYLGSNVASVLGITLYIQRFRKQEHIVTDLESSTEGELIYTNDNLPEWPIRNEISV
ncbi:hypothetical protein LSH36_396g01004 [Paralvinella palmiformis]|uniref:Uncharacterized protein n=1 Tax=Paralvinella palmiformis TaxID=53620 RepID=A0AAD9JDD3_9ANNE|nr:hypothetical protein LSH36_396g01004 [Paralvinella palmiformis]